MKMMKKVRQTSANLLFLSLIVAFYFCAIQAEANLLRAEEEFGKKVSSRQQLDVAGTREDELPRNARNLKQPLQRKLPINNRNGAAMARSINKKQIRNRQFVPMLNQSSTTSSLGPLAAMGLHPQMISSIGQQLAPGQNLEQIESELSEMLFGSDEMSSEEMNPNNYQDKRTPAPKMEQHKNDSMLPMPSELRQRRRRPGGFQSQFRRRQRPRQSAHVIGPHLPGVNRRPQLTPHSNVGRHIKNPIPSQFKKRINPSLDGSRQQEKLRSADCKLYTDQLCLEASNYPSGEILNVLSRNVRVGTDLVADVMDQSADNLIDGVTSAQENKYTVSHYFGENRRQDGSLKATRDFAHDGGFLCPSEIMYAKPKRGKTAQGVWKDIVNVKDYTQTLRMEKCLKPGGECSYVSHHYKSQCSQVYNYHRLLSWSKDRGLHMDIFKVPTCCSCHIMGYSYVYPPLKNGGNPTSPHSPSPPQGSFHDVSGNNFEDIGSDYIDGFGTIIDGDEVGEFVPSQPGGFIFPGEDDEVAGGFANDVAVDPQFPSGPQDDFQNFMTSVTNSGSFPNDVPTTSGRDLFSSQPSNESPSSVVAPDSSPPNSSRRPHQLRPQRKSRPPFSPTNSDRSRPRPQNVPRRRSDTTGRRPIPRVPAKPDEEEINFDAEIADIFGSKATDDHEHHSAVEDDDSRPVNYGYHPIIDFFDRYRWSASK